MRRASRAKALAAAAAAALALAAAAAPATAATPRGQGLIGPIAVTCDGVGTLMVVETRGEAPTAWSTTGLHGVLTSVTISVEGNVVFAKTFGAKAGLTTVHCIADVEDDGILFHIVGDLAFVPPA